MCPERVLELDLFVSGLWGWEEQKCGQKMFFVCLDIVYKEEQFIRYTDIT